MAHVVVPVLDMVTVTVNGCPATTCAGMAWETKTALDCCCTAPELPPVEDGAVREDACEVPLPACELFPTLVEPVTAPLLLPLLERIPEVLVPMDPDPALATVEEDGTVDEDEPLPAVPASAVASGLFSGVGVHAAARHSRGSKGRAWRRRGFRTVRAVLMGRVLCAAGWPLATRT